MDPRWLVHVLTKGVAWQRMAQAWGARVGEAATWSPLHEKLGRVSCVSRDCIGPVQNTGLLGTEHSGHFLADQHWRRFTRFWRRVEGALVEHGGLWNAHSRGDVPRPMDVMSERL